VNVWLANTSNAVPEVFNAIVPGDDVPSGQLMVAE
jgi:hypothetical protein